MMKRAERVLTLLLVMALLLTGCGTAAVPAPKEYTISYYAGDTLLNTETVSEGVLPGAYSPAVQGYRFIRWEDESGAAVDPGSTPATGDAAYYAVLYPCTDAHNPFMTVNAEGCFQPERAVTFAEAADALLALLPEDTDYPVHAVEQPELPLNAAELRNMLAGLWTEAELETAGCPGGDGTVTRAELAVLICALTGRTGERVLPAENAEAPADVTPEAAYYEAVLEAVVPHTAGENGSTWQELMPATRYTEGPVLLDGGLYCCDASGYLIFDGCYGMLSFGEDGLYTSGDPELDAMVAAVLAPMVETARQENPDADNGELRMLLLRQVYDYCMKSFQYRSRNHYGNYHTGWEIEDAKVMLETGKGNCFNFAAAFWALSRGLGFQTQNWCKSLDANSGAHGWSEIVFDDVPYIFDPQLEVNFGNNRYMITYEQGYRYGYSRPADRG